MVDFKQAFGTAASITIGLDSLASATVVEATAVDNSTTLYDDVIVELYIDGTAAASAWLDVRILASIDGTNYGTWDTPYAILPSLELSSDLRRYHARFTPPQKWKLAVKNNTGAALAASGNAASFQGVYYTGN